MPGTRNIQESAPGVDLPVAVSEGGTGATSAADARAALGVAATSHTHAIADTTSLQATLDGKAASSHTHAIADTTGLQAAIDGKAASSHTHTESDVTNLVSDLAGKAASSHSHAQSDVTDLVSALAGKASSSHAHAEADITGLVADLAAKQASFTNFGLWHTGALTHYSTYALAKTAAASGDTLVLGPGNRDLKDLLKDGVNIFAFPGAYVKPTTAGSGAIFDDSSTGANGAVTCSILGFGKFETSLANQSVFKIVNGSNITFEGELLATSGASSTTKLIDQQGSGSMLHITVLRCTPLSTATQAIYMQSGTGMYLELDAQYYDANGAGAISIDLASSTSQMLIDIDRANILNDLVCQAGQQSIGIGSADTMSSADILNTGAGTQVFTISALRSGGVGGFSNSGSGTQYIEADALALNSSGTGVVCSLGTQYVEAQSITITGSTSSAVSCSGGTQIVEARTITTNNATKYAVDGSGGTQRIVQARLQNTGTNGIPLNLGGQTCILEGGCSLIAHSGASVSANAGSAQNLKIYGTAVGNKALDADITQHVGTFVSDANVV